MPLPRDWIGTFHRRVSRLRRELKKYKSPAWSVSLVKAREKLRLLKKLWFELRHGLDYTSTLQSAKDIGVFPNALTTPLTKQMCTHKLRVEACRKVKTIVAESFIGREKKQQESILQYEQSVNESDKKRAALLKRIVRAEALKELLEKIHRHHSPDMRQGITRIEIPLHPSDDPKSCTEWRVIDVPSEIVSNLQSRTRLQPFRPSTWDSLHHVFIQGTSRLLWQQ